MKRILVTGANGFVGLSLSRLLKAKGFKVRGVMRKKLASDDLDFHGMVGNDIGLNSLYDDIVYIGDIGPNTNWSKVLDNVDVIVHLAARVHVMKGDIQSSVRKYSVVNTLGTERLAKTAIKKGVRRIIFVSSIKVNGENSGNLSFTEMDAPNPKDPYAQSKLEAEQLLLHISKETGLEIVILRPPLVYGPNVKGNFLRLLSLIYWGVPLPLGSIINVRSLIYVENFSHLIVRCICYPEASGDIFLAADGEDVSTPELIKQIAMNFKCSPRLISIPQSVIYTMAKLIGKESVAKRLLGSLKVDASKARQVLNWSPPYTLQQGLLDTTNWYQKFKLTSNLH